MRNTACCLLQQYATVRITSKAFEIFFDSQRAGILAYLTAQRAVLFPFPGRTMSS